MDIVLDHTIVHASDPAATARFLGQIFDVAPQVMKHFTVLRFGSTSLDLIKCDGVVEPRHFAFRVDEATFDVVFDRIRQNGPYWADPFKREPGRINHWDDGRGVYFDDPDGHILEVITRSYGSGGCEAKHPNPLLDCA